MCAKCMRAESVLYVHFCAPHAWLSRTFEMDTLQLGTVSTFINWFPESESVILPTGHVVPWGVPQASSGHVQMTCWHPRLLNYNLYQWPGWAALRRASGGHLVAFLSSIAAALCVAQADLQSGNASPLSVQRRLQFCYLGEQLPVLLLQATTHTQICTDIDVHQWTYKDKHASMHSHADTFMHVYTSTKHKREWQKQPVWPFSTVINSSRLVTTVFGELLLRAWKKNNLSTHIMMSYIHQSIETKLVSRKLC